jgi:hypothetical protein
MFERLVRVRGQLAELVTAVDPDAVSGQSARQLWAEFDKVERLGAAGKTLLARRIAATHQPNQHATKTAAEDLARRAGTTTGRPKTRWTPRPGCPNSPRWTARCAAVHCPRRRWR